MSDWLNSLGVGDMVIVSRSGAGIKRMYVDKVARLTKTQIVLEGGERFRRRDGRGINGDMWRYDTIYEPTPHLIDKAKRDSAVRKLALITSRSGWITKIATDDIEKIITIIEESSNGDD